MTFAAEVWAGDTNVFQFKSNLKGSTLDGGVLESIKISADPGSPLLGTLPGNPSLGLAVSDMECLMMGVLPSMKLVAFDGNQIVAPLVEFINPVPIYVSTKKAVFQSRGIAGEGVVEAQVSALITLDYDPCTTVGVETMPTRVQVQPLGYVRPTGTIVFHTPLVADNGQLEILGGASPLFVSLVGQPTTNVTNCAVDLSPNPMNFGSVLVGDSQTRALQIRNNGHTDCVVSNIELSGSSAFSFTNPGQFPLAAGESVMLDITFTPFIVGADNSRLRVTSSDPINGAREINLIGTGTVEIVQCRLGISPLALNFGAVEIGTNATLSVTVTNRGTGDCQIDRITLVTSSTGFAVSPLGPVGIVVAPESAVDIEVTFTPEDTSRANGTLQINTTAADGSETNLTQISLTATGVVAECRLELDTVNLDFGAVVIGDSRVRTVDISNVGVADCEVFEVTGTNGVFALLTPVIFPFTIPPGTTTTLEFDFMPVTNGTTNATIRIATGIPTNHFEIAATGFGVEEVADCSIDPGKTEIAFGNVVVGRTNVIKTTISNIGDSPCTIHSISLTGSNDLSLIAPPFPLDLAPGADFEVAVRYRPMAVGATGGELEILSTTPGNILQIIPITGAGVLVRAELTVDTTNVFFGSLPLSSNAMEIVTLTNTNDLNATITSVRIIGGSGAFALSSTIPTGRFGLRAHESIALPVTFTALSQGTNSAVLRIESVDSSAPLDVALSGEGLRCNLTRSPTSLNFGNVRVGTTNTLTVTLGNTGNIDCEVSDLLIIGSRRYEVFDPDAPFPVIAPGAAVPVQIEYRPDNTASSGPPVIIESGALNSSGDPTQVP